MKRLAPLALLAALAAAPPLFAQEAGSQEQSQPAEKYDDSSGEEGGLQGWKWANFIVLAGAVGYFIGKRGGPFFAVRAGKIRENMEDAGNRLSLAEARAVEAESKLAGLAADLEALREEARRSAEAESERASQRIRDESGKIREHSRMEIDSAGKAARAELRRYAAHLAVELAAAKIGERMTPQSQEALMAGFAQDLARSAPKPEGK